MNRTLTALIVVMLLATPVRVTAGATLVGSCAEGPAVGDVMLPINFAPFALSPPDFDTTACSGTSGQIDGVFCFTPQNGCTVAITSTNSLRPERQEALGGAQWMSVFTGGCVDTPASCVATDLGVSESSISGLAVTGGTTYCVVIQDTEPGRSVDVTVSEESGSCGSLPVTLTGFSVE